MSPISGNIFRLCDSYTLLPSRYELNLEHNQLCSFSTNGTNLFTGRSNTDISLLFEEFFSNHQMNTAYQTFLVTKGFQYSCHWTWISNSVFTYQNNVSNLKVTFYLIPLLPSLQCCINLFSPSCLNLITQMLDTSSLFSAI